MLIPMRMMLLYVGGIKDKEMGKTDKTIIDTKVADFLEFYNNIQELDDNRTTATIQEIANHKGIVKEDHEYLGDMLCLSPMFEKILSNHNKAMESQIDLFITILSVTRNVSDIKVLLVLYKMRNQLGYVDIAMKTRRDISIESGVDMSNLSKCLKRLKECKLLSGDKYRVFPEI